MDPNASASAPPTEGSGEKSAMNQPAPPPYYDNPSAGYPHPGPVYPPQGEQGYGGPSQYGGAPYGQGPYPMGQQPPMGQQHPMGQQYPMQYPGQPNTITVQPKVFVTQGTLIEPVNDYLCYSIFTLLCCCLPLGIAALIYSISAREANHMGDRMAAERSSRTARTLNHVALGLGLGVFLLSIVYIVVMMSVIH